MKESVTRSRWFLELLLVLATVLWGFSYIWVKEVTDSGLNANAFVAIRYGLAALVLLPFSWKELRQVRLEDWKSGALLGLLIYAALLFQSLGLRYTTPANSAFITAAYVVLVPFATWLVMKKRPEKRILLAVVICAVGLYVLNLEPGQSLGMNLGNGLTLLCALCWTVQVTYISVAGQSMGTRLLTVLPLVVAAGIAGIVGLLRGSFYGAGAALDTAWRPIVLCVLMPSVICGLLQSYAQKYVSPDRAAVIYTLESVFGCGISVIMGFEPLSTKLMAGGGLIVCAVLLAQLPPFWKKKVKEEVS